MGLYTLSNITQIYNGRTVLSLPRMEINQGEILAIVGPSGAGKSTLLRLLNFLETPTTGEIVFAGMGINGRVPLEIRRRVTTVFQTPGLLSRSVAANIGYGLRLRGQTLSPTALAQWLNRLGLTGLEKQRPGQLSAGEAQRVALARALVIRPDVLLLDEPTANLDPYNVGLIETIVRQENAAQGTTVVLVTHNIFQARRLAQRTALLLNGQLVEIGKTARLFSEPREAKTAAFLRGELIY